jgi:cytochrome c biogenesis protein CcmG/thiol:disulfide interchange protein DsbE
MWSRRRALVATSDGVESARFLVLIGLAITLAGCAGTPRSVAPSQAKRNAELAGSPAPLAQLHTQADQLLGGGPAAFSDRMRALRGYPVVVNKWASWCTACESEFPQFQQVSLTFGRRVAFLGLDGKDADQAAASFLRQYPVPYPSYTDPQERIARTIRAGTYYPQTIFFNRHGRLVFDHIGAYPSAAALAGDVRRYALS